MTEFPFRSDGDGPQTTTALLATDGEPPRRRPRLLVLGLVGALVLGSGGYALSSGVLTGGGADPTAAPAGKARPVVSRKPVATAIPAPVQLPATYTEPVGRDPFKPLYVVPVVAVAAPDGTGPDGTGPSASPSPTYPLKLTSVAVGTGSDSTTLDVVVSGARQSVLLGQRFGVHGELVVLSVTRSPAGAVLGVTLQVGDDQPALLKIGETISVL